MVLLAGYCRQDKSGQKSHCLSAELGWCCSSEGGRKRRREKREKIEWREDDHGRSSKHRDREGGDIPRERDPRDEKRRRGRDGEARPEREREALEGGEPGGEREKDLRRLRRRVGFAI